MSLAPNLEIYIEINWLIIEFGETFHNTKWKTEISKSLSVFYLVPKHFCCPNWVKSIAHDPALYVHVQVYICDKRVSIER